MVNPQGVSNFIKIPPNPMVLILDGSSEHVAHAWEGNQLSTDGKCNIKTEYLYPTKKNKKKLKYERIRAETTIYIIPEYDTFSPERKGKENIQETCKICNLSSFVYICAEFVWIPAWRKSK